jgi:hypothetical protein
MILATSLPRFKAFLPDLTPCTGALLFVTAFLMQRGRLRVTAAARSIRWDVRDAGNLLRFRAGSRQPALLLATAQQVLLAQAASQRGTWGVAVDSTQHGQQGQKTENAFQRGNKKSRPRKGYGKHQAKHRRSCHPFVFALVLSPGGLRLPFWLPYYTRDYCAFLRVGYQTQAQLAARLIRELPLPGGLRVVVVGDTAFDADSVRQACTSRC